jgi:hypothetical protein
MNKEIPSTNSLSRKSMISPDDLWGIERRSDTPERIVFIYEALVKLNLPPNFSIIDIAGGRGVVLNGLVGLFPGCKPTIVDIIRYTGEWRKHKTIIKQVVMPLQKFIKENNNIYDVVMMLNSYRTWRANKDNPNRIIAKNNFDKWLIEHVKYFITSGADLPYEQGDIRGHDYKEKLQLFKLPLSKKK